MTPEEIKVLTKNYHIYKSAIHPDTQELIPIYMRLSGMVPINIPLVCAILFKTNQTPAFNATMQWLNQTYNALLNYGNRNASTPYT